MYILLVLAILNWISFTAIRNLNPTLFLILYFLDKLTSNIIQFELEGFRIIKNINENIKEEKSENTEI